MRYIVLGAISLFAALLTGGVSPQISILLAEIDFLFIVMVVEMLVEKGITPVLFAAGSAIFLDVFYAPAIGYYSFPYLVIGILVCQIFKNRQLNRYAAPALITAGAWLGKELLTAMLSFFLGNSFDFFYIFVRSTLPGMLINGILAFFLFFLFEKLFHCSFMKPRLLSLEEEFPGLRSRRNNRENAYRISKNRNRR